MYVLAADKLERIVYSLLLRHRSAIPWGNGPSTQSHPSYPVAALFNPVTFTWKVYNVQKAISVNSSVKGSEILLETSSRGFSEFCYRPRDRLLWLMFLVVSVFVDKWLCNAKITWKPPLPHSFPFIIHWHWDISRCIVEIAEDVIKISMPAWLHWER
jgi:hypothetical protein